MLSKRHARQRKKIIKHACSCSTEGLELKWFKNDQASASKSGEKSVRSNLVSGNGSLRFQDLSIKTIAVLQ